MKKSFYKLIERIETNPLEQFDLAAESGYSYTRFIHAFRAQTGLSPDKYITRLRLSRAKQWMRDRSLTCCKLPWNQASRPRTFHSYVSSALWLRS
jgi:AraC-like DNA-binding protein